MCTSSLTQWKHLYGIREMKEQILFLYIPGGILSPAQKPYQIDVFYCVP